MEQKNCICEKRNLANPKIWFWEKLIKFNLDDEGLQLGYEHGGLSDFFGWNRMVWDKNGKTLIATPYFFPYKNNKAIVNRILKR